MTVRHIAFTLGRRHLETLADAVERFHGRREEALLLEALATVWAARDTWRRRWTLPLTPEERARLSLPESLPPLVRGARLIEVREKSHRVARLRELGAPDIVVEHQRRLLARAAAELDPDGPWTVDEMPRPGFLEDDQVDVHGWLELILRAARTPESRLVGAETPEARGWGLPRRIGRVDLEVRVGLGGPATWAVAGDVLDPALHEPLAGAVRRCSDGDVAVSFLAVDNDIDPPWEDLPDA